VRPELGSYASFVWDSITSTDSSKLERVERKSVFLCCGRFFVGVCCNYKSSSSFMSFFLSLLLIMLVGLFQFRIISEIMYHRQTVGLLGRVISPSQGLFLHRTTQRRQTRTNILALSGIRTRDPVYERSRSAPQSARPLDRPFMSLKTKLVFIPYLILSVCAYRLE
jgi:hypothetical protein